MTECSGGGSDFRPSPSVADFARYYSRLRPWLPRLRARSFLLPADRAAGVSPPGPGAPQSSARVRARTVRCLPVTERLDVRRAGFSSRWPEARKT
eukprot:746737-Hanusia_phi.AAC.1